MRTIKKIPDTFYLSRLLRLRHHHRRKQNNQPGPASEISVKYQAGYSGKAKKQIVVYTNDPENPQTNLWIAGVSADNDSVLIDHNGLAKAKLLQGRGHRIHCAVVDSGVFVIRRDGLDITKFDGKVLAYTILQ